MSKHTPGPWEALPPCGPGNYAIVSEKVNESGNFYVAYIPDDHPTAEVNARLIAAAPDLLAACEIVERELRIAIMSGVLGNTWTGLQMAMSDAMHKATGGAA